jgi:hypothetical protein
VLENYRFSSPSESKSAKPAASRNDAKFRMTETPRDFKDKARANVCLSSIALAEMYMLTHRANNRFADNKRVISRSVGAFTRNYADLRADSRLLTALANKHPHVIYGTHSHAADEIRKWYRENVGILVM